MPHPVTIYCDITGRETRLPLKIQGDGMGPALRLSQDVVNLENVFRGANRTFEVGSLNFIDD